MKTLLYIRVNGDAGISIWLIPSEPESALLQQLMSRHPKPNAPHSFPHFHPHVTLATIHLAPPPPPKPDEPAEPAAAAAASTIKFSSHSHGDRDPGPDPTMLLAIREAIPLGQSALRLRFARVLTGSTYYLSIYTAIAPSTELAQLRAALVHAAVGDLKGPGPASPAFPHLSLFYVADEEAHARVRLLQELERERVVRHSEDGLSVALWCAEPDGDGGGGVLEGITGTQIWIVDCEGPVEGWKVLDKILLATSDR
jgi:2',3'-cyclic-nucleotide 3'-phosphodiesterase